ncbi:hypothetical protein LCGC14_2272630, partial [marine sediment metagenome]
MSKTNYKKKKEEKRIIYPILEMETKGTLILPSDFITQINYLHGKVGKEEWSGMLLYDVKSGSPADPKNFILEAKHIFLMDIGSAAYTEYNTDGDIVDIYDNIEEAMEWKTGHIHTHHDMSAYFSGTDTDELNDNVDKHNYYLSLIVNFGAKYASKVAFLSDVHKSAKMNYVDDKGVLQHFKTDKVEKHMVVIDMEVFYDYKSKFFYGRYDQLIEKAKEKAKKEEKERKAKYGNKHTVHVTGYRNGELQYGDESGSNYSFPLGKVEKAPFEGDPKKMTTKEVEDLARNVFSVTPELNEMRSAYQILHVLAGTKNDKKVYYYTWLAENVELIIENFFDQNLEVDEMNDVINEITKSLIRFGNVPFLEDIINGITEVLIEF